MENILKDEQHRLLHLFQSFDLNESVIHADVNIFWVWFLVLTLKY